MTFKYYNFYSFLQPREINVGSTTKDLATIENKGELHLFRILNNGKRNLFFHLKCSLYI